MSGNSIQVGDLVQFVNNPGTFAIVEKIDYDIGFFAWGTHPYNWTGISEIKLHKSNRNRQKEANARMSTENPIMQLTEGIKKDSGKAPISYIPSEFILGIADVFAFGAKKYAAHNFRLGMAHSRVLDAATRHILAILKGEEIDPESGLPHIYHAGCSLAMYDYMRLHHPDKCDIFELNKRKKNDEPTTTP